MSVPRYLRGEGRSDMESVAPVPGVPLLRAGLIKPAHDPAIGPLAIGRHLPH